MNYLAHLYLAGENEDLLIGNFIGDYVKGKKYLKFPSKIQEGIIMHRNIDTFTDQHKNFREAKKLLQPEFGLHSGIVIDLFYDHFLAKNWRQYSYIGLKEFSKKVHSVLLKNFSFLPTRVQGFLPVLIRNHRLQTYATVAGIQKSLAIMSNYTSLPSKSNEAINIMVSNNNFLEKNFSNFMQDLIKYVEEKFHLEITRPDSNINF